MSVVLPPAEREQLKEFAKKVGRPQSWVVRDALRLYMEAAEREASALASVRVDMKAAGRTRQGRPGRPAKQ